MGMQTAALRRQIAIPPTGGFFYESKKDEPA